MSWLRTSDGKWLLAIFALALIVRLVTVAAVHPDPRDGRFDDSSFYDSAAQHLAAGDGYVFDPTIWVTSIDTPIYPGRDEPTPTALWPPGWPVTLAGIYLLTDDSPAAGRVANAIFGALTCALVFLIALRLFGRLEAIFAGGALALMPSHLLFTAILLSESYFGFLLAAALAVCVYFVFGRERPYMPVIFGLGALIAFTGLVRGEMLAFGGIVALLMAFQWRTRAVAPLAALALGAALVITPWAVRNAITMDEFLVGTTGSGRVSYQGHNPLADGGPSLWAVGQCEGPFAALPLNEIEVKSNRECSRLARQWALDHPWEEVQLAGKRMWKLFRNDEAGVTWLQSNKAWFSPENADRLINLSTFYFYGLAAVMFASLPVWWRLRDLRRLVVFAIIPYYILIFGVLFIGDPRYHYAMYIPLAVFGGAGLAALWRMTSANWRDVFEKRSLEPALSPAGTPEH